MASIVPNENQGSSLHESDTSQKVHVNHTDMDGRTISDDNDRNSNVSPSKASDPARKKTFKIISVKKGGTDTGSGDIVNDNDADSVDGLELDESQTEDYSSEFYDSSKATDIDIDAQDTPLTPDEVGSTTTIVMKQRPDQNSQSRFKVVRIETKDPFRRGKWVCHDFFDSAPAAVVTLNGSKAIEDSIIQSALPVALNSSSSVHYVHDVNESSSNLFVAPVVPINPSAVHGQPILTDMFFPIQPALASQAQGLIDGSQNVVTQYPQPIHMSVAGVPSSSSSFHNLAQPGVTTIVQSLPHTNVFPYAQNGPSSTFLNGNAADKSSQPIMPNSTMVAVSGSGPSLPPSMASIPNAADSELEGAKRAAQPFTVTSPGTLIHSQTPVQTHLPHQGIVTADGGVGLIIADNSQVAISSAGGGGGAIIGVVGQTPAGIAVVNPEDIKVEATSSIEQMGPGMDESMSSVKTLEPGDTQDPAKLEEAVETMYIGLEGTEEDTDEKPCAPPGLSLQARRPQGWPERFTPLGCPSTCVESLGPCLVCTPIGSAFNSPAPSPLTVPPPSQSSPGGGMAGGTLFLDGAANFAAAAAAAYSSVSSPQTSYVGLGGGAPPNITPPNGGPTIPAFLVSSSTVGGDYFLPAVPPMSMAFPGLPGPPPPASFYAPAAASAMFAPLQSMYSGMPSAFTAPIPPPMAAGDPAMKENLDLAQGLLASPQPYLPQVIDGERCEASRYSQHQGGASDVKDAAAHCTNSNNDQSRSSSSLAYHSQTNRSPSGNANRSPSVPRQDAATGTREASKPGASGVTTASTTPGAFSNTNINTRSNNNNNNIHDLFVPQQKQQQQADHQPAATVALARKTDNDEDGEGDSGYVMICSD